MIINTKVPPADEIFRNISYEPETKLCNLPLSIENKLRATAQSNSKTTYLNVQISGLSGAPHTALFNINRSQDALRLRFYLKFLTEDYLTAERLAINHGTNPSCKLCEGKVESESIADIQ